MHPSNHTEASPSQYLSFSTTTDGLHPAPDTEDYPEISDALPTTEAVDAPDPHQALQAAAGEPVENEKTLWEGQTSSKNFLVRLLVGETLTVAWIALAIATWGFGYGNLAILTVAVGVALLLFWALTGMKVFRGSTAITTGSPPAGFSCGPVSYTVGSTRSSCCA